MKTTTFLILWIFLTFSIHAGNRIPNPGFEEEKDRFWYRTNFGGGEGSVMRVTEKAFSGKGSMRLSKTKAPGGVLLIGLVPLPENWSSGTLSFQMCSADGNAGNAVCELSFFHKIDGKMKPYNNSLKRPYSIRRTLKPGTSWEKVLMKISLPEGIERKNLYLRICLNMSIYQKPATLFVDDFSLTDETEESEKSPLHITFSEPSELSAREKQDYEPMQQPVRIELRDGLMLRDGSPYYWIGNGCELTLPALWLARLSDTAMIDRSYGLFPDLKQTADGCRFSAERGLKGLPADQSWNRECLRLGMPYRHLIGGVPYYSWLSLWKLTAKDPALQQIFAPQGHYLFADIGNETGWEATRLVIRNRLKYNNFAPPFALELSREPGYAPTGERMISGFRQYARRKYGTLEKANRAWKTTFSSWEQIYPLHLRPDLKSESIHKLRELAREREPELYYDWLTFCKDDFQESVRRWADFVRKTAPGTPVSIDVRGHTHFLDCYCAMNPEEVTRFADIFYIHQAYQAFRHSAPIDLETLCTQTAYPLFNYNYFRNNVDKPFLDTESVLMRVGVPGSAWKAMERNDLAQLHSSWKFRMDEHFEGEKEQWYAPGFDDSSWDTLTVPGCWDRTEKYRRRIGRAWYRKTFRAPKAVRLDFLDGTRRFYLYGGGLAQSGTIWLNGKKVGEVKGWNTRYQFDVSTVLKYENEENVLTVMVDGGGYDNGIRNYLHLLSQDLINDVVPYSEKEYRALLWTCLMRGSSGIFLWNWALTKDHPFRWLGRLSEEINSVSSFVLPDVRKMSGKVAYLYAYRSMRGLPYPGDGLCSDHLNYFNAMELNQVSPDVLSESAFRQNVSRYPLAVIPYARFVEPETWTVFRNYVENGGTAVVTFRSLEKTTDRFEPTGIETLAGVRIEGAYTGKMEVCFGKERIPLSLSKGELGRGVRLRLSGAQCVAAYPDGSPAVTLRKVGRGQLIFVGARLDFFGVTKLLSPYLPKPEIKLATAEKREYPFVEARTAGNSERRILYLFNHGGLTHPLTVSIPECYAAFRARPLVGKFERTSPTEFRLRLDSGTPVVILLEKESASPLTLCLENPARDTLIRKIESLNRNAPPDCRQKVLFLNMDHPRMGPMGRLFFPYLAEAFRSFGYESDSLPITDWTPEKLREYAAVVIPEFDTIPLHGLFSRTNPKKYAEIVQDYVRDGGSLLILAGTGDTVRIQAKSILELGSRFGVGIGGAAEHPLAYSSRHRIFGDPFQFESSEIAQHPVTAGVKKVQFHALRPLMIFRSRNPEMKALVSVPGDAEHNAGAPVIAGGPFGKGRVAVSACVMWCQPFRIEYADNAILLHNLAAWLLKRTPDRTAAETFRKTLFLTEKTYSPVRNVPGKR